MTDPYFASFDAQLIDRQVLSWAVATRLQLDRWEPLVAEFVSALFGWVPEQDDASIWRAQFEHHFCLIAAHHLLISLGMLDPPVQVDPTLRAEIRETRHLHEHWVDNMPVFNTRPRTDTPPHGSGRAFAARNPTKGPYDWLMWDSKNGPKLVPNVSAQEVHVLLDEVQTRILAGRPDLARFLMPRAASPWIRDDKTGEWWPGRPTSG